MLDEVRLSRDFTIMRHQEDRPSLLDILLEMIHDGLCVHVVQVPCDFVSQQDLRAAGESRIVGDRVMGSWGDWEDDGTSPSVLRLLSPITYHPSTSVP